MSVPTLRSENKGSYCELTPLEEAKTYEDDFSSTDDCYDEVDEDSLVPDGGWGWVVCGASFMVNFILDGTMFSFGILMNELLDDMKETKSVTSWVGSALLGMSMFMGPVVSMLLKRFSIRQVTIAGSLISSFGFVASVFAPNIGVLVITYGIIGGIGFSMIFLPAIIVVGLYFSKRRAIATGIATSGSGLGTFTYAYICDHLLQEYSWRQTVMILGGILLHCVACGMVFRPLLPAPPRRRKRKSFYHRKLDHDEGRDCSCCRRERAGSGDSSSSECSTSEEREMSRMMKKLGIGGDNTIVKVEELSQDEQKCLDNIDIRMIHNANDVGDDDDALSVASSSSSSSSSSSPPPFCLHPLQLRNSRHKHHRRHHRHHHRMNYTGLPLPITVPTGSGGVTAACSGRGRGTGGKTAGSCRRQSLAPPLMPDDRLYRSVQDIGVIGPKAPASDLDAKFLFYSETLLAPNPAEIAQAEEQKEERQKERSQIALGMMRPIFRKDIYYSGSVSHLAEYQSCGRSMTSFLAHMTRPDSDETSGSSLTTLPEVGIGGGGSRGARMRRKCAKLMRSFMDPALFRSKSFLCLLITCTMWAVQSVPMTYLPNMAVSKGISRDDAAFLISIVGITNTIGRILAGVLTDVVRLRCIWLYAASLLLASVLNYVMPWCQAFSALAAVAALFGLCMAVWVSMRTIVLAEQLGIAVLTKSFGVIALFQGVAFTVTPPSAGKLFDETGDYFLPFTMAGTMFLISGLASLCVALWLKPEPASANAAMIISVEEVVVSESSDSSAGNSNP